ncbi:MAG: pre-rRNA-processing protein PNO1 [Candidatus Nanohaloarchaea archaeon]
MKEVRIPEERVGVLIGEGGETLDELEEMTDCSLEVTDNLVRINGGPLDEMDAQNIVKAIGRGFNPDKALRLVEIDVMLHIMDINRFANTRNSRDRLKGRVIGRDGEARRHIEKEANVELAVYGKTIAIIGEAQNIEVASEAIKMLLQGSSHSTAWDYIEKNRANIKR